MQRSILIFILASLGVTWSGDVSADRRKDAERCAEVKDKIREIEARMRRGYTAAQGIRLEERLRKLKDERYDVCR